MLRGYKQHYNRRVYSRSKMQLRDLVYEGLIANKCENCGVSLQRKITKNGSPESLTDFKQRRTCGNVWSNKERKYIKSECLLSISLEDKNGNWKGGKNDCLMCGKKVRWYPSKNEPQKYCYQCYQTKIMPNLYKTNPHTYKKGNKPKCPFKKGQKAHNKIYDFCTVKDCGKKHLAKGLCSKHYQRNQLLDK